MPRHPTLSVFLLCCAIVAGPTARASDENDFRIAYKMYQEAEARGDKKAMLEYSRSAWELGQRVYPADSKSLPALAYNHGRALNFNGDSLEAEKVLLESLEMFEAAYGPGSRELLDPLMELGRATPTFGDGAIQKKYFDRALDLAADLEGRNSLLYAALSLEAGSALLTDSKSARAEKYIERAYRIFVEQAGPGDVRTAKAAFWMGKYYMSEGRYYAAEEPLKEALVTFEQLTEPSNAMELTTHAFLVDVYERKGQRDEATRHCLAIGRMSPAVPDQMYEPVFKPYPEYPTIDRRAGNEGHVIFEVTVDENGFVTNPMVKESTLSPTLLESALDAVQRARYAPRFVDGKPVASPGILFKVGFKLTDIGERS